MIALDPDCYLALVAIVNGWAHAGADVEVLARCATGRPGVLLMALDLLDVHDCVYRPGIPRVVVVSRLPSRAVVSPHLRDRTGQIARLVHGAAFVGTPIEALLRASGGSRLVVLRAMTFVDPAEDVLRAGDLPWNDVLGILQAVLERCDQD